MVSFPILDADRTRQTFTPNPDPAQGALQRRYPGGFQEFLFREGEPFSRYGYNSTAVVAGASTNFSLTATTLTMPYIGKASYVEAISAWCNIPVIAQININGSTDSKFPGFTLQRGVGPNAGCDIPVRSIIRGFELQSAVVEMKVRKVFDAAPTTVDLFGTVSASGWAITDDFNWSAKHPVLFVGDSILNSTGVTKTAEMWPFLVREHLISLGYDPRVILKSVSGSTTTDHEGWRKAGYHDIAPVSLIVYALSVNDAGAAVSDATYTANITAFWNWAKFKYPDAKVVICGTTPLENNTSETRAVGLRTAASDYVTSVASPRLKYINLGDAFDRTSGTTNYAASDSAGSRVHPNVTGHAAIGSIFNTRFDALGLTLEAV